MSATTKPKLGLDEVQPAQFTHAMDLQLRTFLAAKDVIHGLAVPGDPDADSQAAARNATRMAKGRDEDASQGAESRYWQAVADNGEMAGCAIWKFWPAGKPGGQTRVNVDWIENDQATTDYAQWALDEEWGMRKKHIPDGPFALLEILFTVAAHQRKGAGSLLVNAGVRRAEELGVDQYIHASPFGRPLYESCGFRVLEEFTPVAPAKVAARAAGDDIHLYFMKRPLGGWKD